MANIGLFFEKKFKNKPVEFYIGMDREWITYADSSTINGALMSVVFKEYDSESGILTFCTMDEAHIVYVSEDSIEMFWEPGEFNLMEHTRTMLNTGQRIFNQKHRDIM